MKRSEKSVQFTRYALRRMDQRSVSREQVRQTIRNPQSSRPAKIKGAKVYERALSRKKRLAVIVDETPSEITVLNAFWR